MHTYIHMCNVINSSQNSIPYMYILYILYILYYPLINIVMIWKGDITCCNLLKNLIGMELWNGQISWIPGKGAGINFTKKNQYIEKFCTVGIQNMKWVI